MPKNPLVEVFGYRADDMSRDAARHRAGKFCPFGNSSGDRCTKSSKTDPLGVCTVLHKDAPAITCPVRFRQDKVMVADAAKFFFPRGSNYIPLTEVRLHDKHGKSAGNIDMVLAIVDTRGRVMDFGALEVQAVYISGNVRDPFEKYMENSQANARMDWNHPKYPQPEYLSSSRKRLAPQLMFKGTILHRWGKKMAVAVHTPFFAQLPRLTEVEPARAKIAWLTYDLRLDAAANRYKLETARTYHTDFQETLRVITVAEPGDVGKFVKTLEQRIKKGELRGKPPESELEPEVEPPISLSEDDVEDS